MKGILLIGGKDEDNAWFDECLFYQESESGGNLLECDNSMFPMPNRHKIRCSIITFGDTDDSQEIFIYLLNGSMTAQMQIERIRVRLINGMKVIDDKWDDIFTIKDNLSYCGIIKHPPSFRHSEGICHLDE